MEVKLDEPFVTEKFIELGRKARLISNQRKFKLETRREEKAAGLAAYERMQKQTK